MPWDDGASELPQVAAIREAALALTAPAPATGSGSPQRRGFIATSELGSRHEARSQHFK
jgi:hypothetical protein